MLGLSALGSIGASTHVGAAFVSTTSVTEAGFSAPAGRAAWMSTPAGGSGSNGGQAGGGLGGIMAGMRIPGGSDSAAMDAGAMGSHGLGSGRDSGDMETESTIPRQLPKSFDLRDRWMVVDERAGVHHLVKATPIASPRGRSTSDAARARLRDRG